MKKAPLHHPRVFDDPDFARKYRKRHEKLQRTLARKLVRELDEAGLREGRVLDAGCGFGLVSVQIARAFPRMEVVGIDLSEPLLDIGRSLAREGGVEGRLTFVRGSVEDLPFRDNDFDVVLNTYMFHIVEDPVAMLDEMERVLRPCGILMLRDLRRCWLGYLDKTFKTCFTEVEARELLGRSNLRPWEMTAGGMHIDVRSKRT